MIEFLRTHAFRRGVLGSSPVWFTVWFTIGVARFLRKRVTRDDYIVERIVLKPGESVEVRDTGVTWQAFGA